LRDGQLVAASEEERFTRVKHDPRMPISALRFCLDSQRLSIRDVDCVAYYEDPVLKLGRQLWMGLPRALNTEAIGGRLDPWLPKQEIWELIGFEGRIEFVGHHEAHAASAYYFSGYPEAAVLTVDGVGEWSTTTYGHGNGHSLSIFEEVQFPHSLGLLYSTITSYLGFRVNDGEYKVMGLAPYGQPHYTHQVRRLIHCEDAGQFRLDMHYFDFMIRERMYSDALPELFGAPPRIAGSELLPFHADVARSVQVVLEEILIEKAQFLHSRVPSDNICMAGGVALNCVANGKLLRHGPFRSLFVQPAASDAGGSLGAAAIAHALLTGKRPSPERLAHVYLGPSFTTDEISRQLDAMPLSGLQDFRQDEAGLVEAAAARLAEGKVLGWFHGRHEFGPRSLGARSILADPRAADMRDRINASVKKREAFRPFAPAVLAEKAEQHFEIDHASPFMLETCQVKSPLSLPAITHVDGSARVQTVDARESPRFAALLREFDRITGCPLLLNTSFNMRDEPIVHTPLEAIACFARSQIDCLVLEDFIIDRTAVPIYWSKLFDLLAATGPETRRVDHAVYTFG
jgi:carbamoyltransferase